MVWKLANILFCIHLLFAYKKTPHPPLTKWGLNGNCFLYPRDYQLQIHEPQISSYFGVVGEWHSIAVCALSCRFLSIISVIILLVITSRLTLCYIAYLQVYLGLISACCFLKLPKKPVTRQKSTPIFGKKSDRQTKKKIIQSNRQEDRKKN